MTMTEFSQKVDEIEQACTNDFAELARMAGLDPATDFRYMNLENIDFSNCNLNGFDFTGSPLNGSNFSGASIEGAIFDEDNFTVVEPFLSTMTLDDPAKHEESIRDSDSTSLYMSNNVDHDHSIESLHDLEYELFESCRRAERDIVEKLISLHVDLDARTNGITPLMEVSKNGNFDIVNLLLNAGVNVNARTPQEHTTSLHLACDEGHRAIAVRLLKAGADPNALRFGENATPLMCAIDSEDEILVQSLLDEGADPNLSSNDSLDESALHQAISRGLTSIVNVLLQHGADPNSYSLAFKSPLVSAVYEGNIEVIKMLIDSGVDRNISAEQWQQILRILSETEESEIKSLLEYRFNII